VVSDHLLPFHKPEYCLNHRLVSILDDADFCWVGRAMRTIAPIVLGTGFVTRRSCPCVKRQAPQRFGRPAEGFEHHHRRCLAVTLTASPNRPRPDKYSAGQVSNCSSAAKSDTSQWLLYRFLHSLTGCENASASAGAMQTRRLQRVERNKPLYSVARYSASAVQGAGRSRTAWSFGGT
jgi:hypothetical protein